MSATTVNLGLTRDAAGDARRAWRRRTGYRGAYLYPRHCDGWTPEGETYWRGSLVRDDRHGTHVLAEVIWREPAGFRAWEEAET